MKMACDHANCPPWRPGDLQIPQFRWKILEEKLRYAVVSQPDRRNKAQLRVLVHTIWSGRVKRSFLNHDDVCLRLAFNRTAPKCFGDCFLCDGGGLLKK